MQSIKSRIHAIKIKLSPITSKLQKYIPYSPIVITRRIVQVYFFLMINLYLFTDVLAYFGIDKEKIFPINSIYYFLKDNISFFYKYLPAFPIEQSVASPFTTIPGVLDILQLRVTSAEFPYLEIAIILLTAVFLGRLFCGWVCPFGLIQDILAFLPIKKYEPTPSVNKDFARMKYFILGVILLLVSWVGISKARGVGEALVSALGPYSRIPWAVISPVDTIETFIPALLENERFFRLIEKSRFFDLSPYFWIRFAFLIFIIILSLFIRRGYCRYFCPTGALMGVLSKYSLLHFKINPVRCTNCELCEKACPMGIRFLREGSVIKSPECIYCGNCWAACPEKAIRPRFL